MKTIKAFIKSQPLLSYFAVAFAISWGSVLMVIGGPGGIPATPEQSKMLFPIVLLAMFAAPSAAGPPVDRPPLWEGWLSRPPRQNDEVAGCSPLVRCSAQG